MFPDGGVIDLHSRKMKDFFTYLAPVIYDSMPPPFFNLSWWQSNWLFQAVKDYEEYRCGITSDEEAMKKHGAADGQVILFKKFDQGRAVYEGAIGKDAMMEFIQRYAIPL